MHFGHFVSPAADNFPSNDQKSEWERDSGRAKEMDQAPDAERPSAPF